jgi:hypothetical protein
MENFDPSQKSKGLGDTIAKVTHFFGIDKVADAVAKLAGAEGCGCAERKEMLNELFPYDSKVRKFKVLKQFNWREDIYFEGQVVEVNKEHPLYAGVITLVKDGVIEELEK